MLLKSTSLFCLLLFFEKGLAQVSLNDSIVFPNRYYADVTKPSIVKKNYWQMNKLLKNNAASYPTFRESKHQENYYLISLAVFFFANITKPDEFPSYIKPNYTRNFRIKQISVMLVSGFFMIRSIKKMSKYRAQSIKAYNVSHRKVAY